jgi:TfoX/Sxy family transcriptional regulator of competence genes
MAYDENLARRMRAALAGEPDVGERKMFGGLAFMVRGNMCCGVIKDEMMVRVGKDLHDEAMARPHTRVMDFTHRPMPGMVYVEKPGFESDADLKEWIDLGLRFNRTLPAK